MERHHHIGWAALAHHWQRDLQLLLFIAAALFLFRLVMLGLFSDQLSAAINSEQLLLALRQGLRFDFSSASAWVLITFLLAPFLSWSVWHHHLHRLRAWSGRLFVFFGTLLLCLDVLYFRTFGDHFNQLIFGIVYDDTRAILTTIWKEYHPMLFLLESGILIYFVGHIHRRWMDAGEHWLATHARERGLLFRLLMVGLFVTLFVLASRGFHIGGPPLLMKEAYVSRDMYLNHIVPNPLQALYQTIEKKVMTERSGGFLTLWPSGNLQQAVQVAFGRSGSVATPITDLDQLSQRVAAGLPVTRPRHIFVVLLESFSGWTVMPAYRSVGLAPELSALADRGIYVPANLPAGNGTMPSLNVLVSGLPASGVHTNYEPSSAQPFPTAIAENFKRLGYRTRFFYGGMLGWQRVDQFLPAQGFDEVYGGGHVSAEAHMNEWGVDDAALFDFVLDQLDNREPSFNFILTTSNHAPYDLDLASLGFPVKSLPASWQTPHPETLKRLGHLWYSDREMGRFVRIAEQRLDHTLFAITGDHTERLGIRFPGDSTAEQYVVPLVIYGPDVLHGLRLGHPVAGSHLDLLPTLYELAAPAGTNYYAYGHSLFDKGVDEPAFGLGIIGPEWYASHSGPPTVYRLPGVELPNPLPDVEQLRQQYRALAGLACYRVQQGPEIATPH